MESISGYCTLRGRLSACVRTAYLTATPQYSQACYKFKRVSHRLLVAGVCLEPWGYIHVVTEGCWILSVTGQSDGLNYSTSAVVQCLKLLQCIRLEIRSLISFLRLDLLTCSSKHPHTRPGKNSPNLAFFRLQYLLSTLTGSVIRPRSSASDGAHPRLIMIKCIAESLGALGIRGLQLRFPPTRDVFTSLRLCSGQGDGSEQRPSTSALDSVSGTEKEMLK